MIERPDVLAVWEGSTPERAAGRWGCTGSAPAGSPCQDGAVLPAHILRVFRAAEDVRICEFSRSSNGHGIVQCFLGQNRQVNCQ